MGDSVSFKLTGLDSVINKMRTLAPKLLKTGVRKAARKGMNIVRDSARVNARAIDDPETRAKIYKNIITQESTKQGKRVGGIVMRVGVRGGASSNKHSIDITGLSGGDTRHWRYIENGTSYIPAIPFMRRAFSSNIGRVTDKFAGELTIEIDKAVKS